MFVYFIIVTDITFTSIQYQSLVKIVYPAYLWLTSYYCLLVW